jgi:hypothetical protein
MVRMVIASDWEKKARDTKAVNSERFSSHRLHDDFHGPWVNVDLLFSVKVFLTTTKNKIQIFSCRF